ncbi:MAG: Hpt domain-containing protein [Oligoflexales bacterium]
MENTESPLYSAYAADPLFGPLLADFAEELPSIIEDFKGNLRNEDKSQAIKDAHRIAGSLATYGFSEFAACLAQMEKDLKNGTFPADWTDREMALDNYCARVTTGIKGS